MRTRPASQHFLTLYRRHNILELCKVPTYCAAKRIYFLAYLFIFWLSIYLFTSLFNTCNNIRIVPYTMKLEGLSKEELGRCAVFKEVGGQGKLWAQLLKSRRFWNGLYLTGVRPALKIKPRVDGAKPAEEREHWFMGKFYCSAMLTLNKLLDACRP